MNRIILFLPIWMGLLASLPVVASELNSLTGTPNFDKKVNLPIAPDRPTYQRGYTVHYRNSSSNSEADALRWRSLFPRRTGMLRQQQWTLEGFYAERRDAERAAMRLQRSGFKTQVRSRAAAERRRTGGY